MTDMDIPGGPTPATDQDGGLRVGPTRRQAGDANALGDDLVAGPLHPDVRIDDCGRSSPTHPDDATAQDDADHQQGGDGGGDKGGDGDSCGGDEGSDDGDGDDDGNGDDGDSGGSDGDGKTSKPARRSQRSPKGRNQGADAASGQSGQANVAGSSGQGDRGTVTPAAIRQHLTRLLATPGAEVQVVRCGDDDSPGGLIIHPCQLASGATLATPRPLAFAPAQARGRARQAATLSGVLLVDGAEWDVSVTLKSQAAWRQRLAHNFDWLADDDQAPPASLKPMAPRRDPHAWYLEQRH